ncbi:MAG: SDR family NAD(P)-dependent oxidoreductase, partial [Spirochaetia bacterium]|nr:SDR family NAD(P)-dependent oxidoreductase [Spirochaetia bacterium]
MSNVFAANLFQGKRALVTGGGSGIGLAMARDFLLYGADAVVILGRNADKLAAAVESLKRDTGCKPDQILTLAANIRAEEEVEQACTRIAGTLGSLDILVNNAGGQFPSRTEDISAKGWHAVIETNLTGTFLMSKAFFLRFLKERGGSVVNILMNMRSGMPLMPHSAAARAGVDNLTKSWAVEWAHYGVRVNAVAPGIIASSGLDTYAPEFQAKLAETKKN